MQRRWYRVNEVSEYLSIPPKSVYSLISKGIIPHTRIKGLGIRIDLPKLDELLEKHSIDSILNQLDR